MIDLEAPTFSPAKRQQRAVQVLEWVDNFPEQNVAEDLPTFTERKRVIPAGSTARPGPYRYKNTPQWREVAYAMSESEKTTEGVVMAATQTGKTENMLNHELYCVEYGIGPICYVSSDEGLALKHSETRFNPMLKAAKMLEKIRAAVETRANKSGGNKLSLKFFMGTFIQFIGALSESKASSTPIRVLHIDEIDKFKNMLVGGGNPVKLLLRRTDSYGPLKKILYVSTPKRKATSQIEPLFEQGDMRYYHVECQGCKGLHRLEWKLLKWDKDESGRVMLEYDDDGNLINDPVWHECPHCGYKMRGHEKVIAMQEEGHGGHAKWIPTKKPDRPGLKSWHCSGLYGFRSWLDIVIEFQDAKDDPILLENFVCDTLAETWTEEADKPDQHFLAARAETDIDLGQIPPGVLLLTLGCDVHKDRLEWQLVGWMRNKESWIIEYGIEEGETIETNDQCWDNLENVIRGSYTSIDNRILEVSVALIDAGGVASNTVHEFCSRFMYNPGSWVGVYPSFGKQTLSNIVKEYKSSIPQPDLHMDEQRLKKEIYSNLKKKVPPRGNKHPGGFVHFPGGLSVEYFKQLTSEDIIEEVGKSGKQTGVRQLLIANPHGRRNEALDTYKLALAGMYFIYLKYFELWNTALKKKRKKEIPNNWNLFWSQFGAIEDVDNSGESE